MDPHGPYDRHPHADGAGLGPLPEEFNRPLTARERKKLPHYLRLRGKSDLGSYIEAYDRASAAWDEAFGEWLEWIEAREAREARRVAPLIAVVADHGEEFAEHGGWNHGETLFEEQLLVPWVIRSPDRAPQRIQEHAVSLIDVAPTLLAAVGVRIPESMQGSDVLGAVPAAERPLFSETEIRIGGIPDPRYLQRAVRRGATKHVERPSGSECYDLESDPREQHASCSRVGWRARAESDLKQWARRNRNLAKTLGAAAAVELDPEQQERLRAIGYLE
jgi:arylsulfatase A-like enzyme